MRYLIVKDLAFLPQRKKGGKTGLLYRKICNSQKSFKTSTKSWLKTKRGTQNLV